MSDNKIALNEVQLQWFVDSRNTNRANEYIKEYLG